MTREWHVWDREYPDEGSITVFAHTREEALRKGYSEFGEGVELGLAECTDDCPCEEV